MKRLFCIIAIVLLASPLLAQDDSSGFEDGGGFFSDDGGGFFGDGGGRGSGGAPQGDRLADVRRWLAQANAAPLARDQERPLTTLIENEVKVMTEAFQTRFGHPPGAGSPAQGRGQSQGGGREARGIQGQRGGGVPGEAPGAGQARGARGAAFSRVPPEEAAEMRRMNEALTSRVIGALKPDQQTTLRKWQSIQIQNRRLDTLKRDMTAAGVALTPEQLPKVEALYVEEVEARTQMLLEFPGPLDQAKVNQLETQTVLKVVRLLTPEQRKALTDAVAKARGGQAAPSR